MKSQAIARTAALALALAAVTAPSARASIFGWDWSWEPDIVGAEAGTSLCLADVNADGYTDLVVGAPDYLHMDVLEVGAVFVFHGGPDGVADSPSWTMTGPAIGCRFGESVASGDVDGDGDDDLFVGAPRYTNGQADEGRVLLYAGSPSGLAATAAWSNEGGAIDGRYGCSLATGDFNDDGRADILIGAYQVTNTKTREGRAIIFAGTPTGPSVWPIWAQVGGQVDAHYGYAVANAGDVNADGIEDFMVGAPEYDFSTSLDRDGAAWVYLGSASTLSSTPVWFGHGESSNARYGAAVAGAGDVNGDGYADIILGAPSHSGGESWEGKAYVHLGRSGGVMSGAAFTTQSDQAFAYLGTSVASAGDLNGDGRSDVLIGVSHFDETGAIDEGMALVHFGSASGVAWTADLGLTGILGGSQMGRAVSSAGDLNGDGYSDFAVGAPGFSGSEGRVYVVYGTALLPSVTPNFTLTDPRVPGPVWGYEQTDLGRAGASGDFNGDGFTDLVTSAKTLYLDGEPIGGLRVHHGSPSGPSPEPDWRQGEDTMGSGGRFPDMVANAGDTNGDGYEDLLCTTELSGNLYLLHLFLGSPAGLGAAPAWEDTMTYVMQVGGAGDVNGDGYADFAVAGIEPNEDPDDGIAFGAIRLFLGNPDGVANDPDRVLVIREAEVALGVSWLGFGDTVGNAGDLNSDGFSDLFVSHVNATPYLTGRVYVFAGSPAGPDTSAVWSLDGPAGGYWFGEPAGPAGDVNGDGYGDFIAAGTLDARLFFGGPDGPAPEPAWQIASPPQAVYWSVAGIGDLTGDGYDDILLGAPKESSNDAEEAGRLYLFAGGPVGPGANAQWSIYGSSGVHHEHLGQFVLAAGDLNGDGWSDFAVGAPDQWQGEPDEQQFDGAVNVFYGNRRTGAMTAFDLSHPDGDVMAPSLSLSEEADAVRLSTYARSAIGRTDVGLEVEVKALDTPFDGTGLFTVPMEDTGAPVPGIGCVRILDEVLSGLESGIAHQVRYRFVADSRFAPRTPWTRLAVNPRREAAFRTEGGGTSGIADTGLGGDGIGLRLASANPFVTRTSIGFSLPSEQFVSMCVFDANGRLVRTLLGGWQPAGDGSVEWDGKGDRGQDAGSGVFFAKMTARDAAEAIRLVRVR